MKQQNHSVRPQLCRQSISAVALATLAACGGNESGTESGAGVLQGVAATGAPMVGATVVVRDARGAEVQRCNGTPTCTVGEDGHFRIELPSGTVAPLVLQATPKDAGAVMVSMSTSAASATVNITPISTLVAAQLSSTRDPVALAPSAVTASALEAAKTRIMTALKPLLDAAGSQVDPLTGSFQADGVGLDKALEALSVQVIRAADGTAQTVAEVKLNGDDVQHVPSLTLSPGSDPVPKNMDQVSGAKLPADGLGPMLQALVKELGACFNLPYAERVDARAGTLKAQACKDLFYDGSPATYKNNGYRVGPAEAANTTFHGLFANRDESGPAGARNTVTFDSPVYEFTRSGEAAGDVVVTYHWRDAHGNEDWNQVVLRPQSGALRLYGNQYDYDARVRPISQRRTFMHNGSAAMSYDASGYNTWVRNHLDSQGQPLFERVVLTAPNGRQFTLRPSAASDRLGHVKRNADGTVSATNTPVIRLQWAFLGSDSHVGVGGKDIADLDTSLVFARDANGVASPWDETAMRALPQQGKWKYTFYLSDGSSKVQWVTTLARAQTLKEMRAQAFASVTDAVKADMAASIDTGWNGIPVAGEVIDLTEPGGAPSWQVPTGALAPTSIQVNGNLFPNHPGNGAGRVPFTDGAAVPSTARSGQIRCGQASRQDAHCDGTQPGLYAAGTFVTTFELWGKNERALERSMMYTFYKLVP